MSELREELKPCPFCGGEAAEFGHDEHESAVGCVPCGISTQLVIKHTSDPMVESIAAWNRRATPARSSLPPDFGELIDGLVDTVVETWTRTHHIREVRTALEAAIASALGSAEEMRERAAKVCDKYAREAATGSPHPVCRYAAADIRRLPLHPQQETHD